MTPQERKQLYIAVKTVLPLLTDEELKALVAIAITRETIDGIPLSKL